MLLLNRKLPYSWKGCGCGEHGWKCRDIQAKSKSSVTCFFVENLNSYVDSSFFVWSIHLLRSKTLKEEKCSTTHTPHQEFKFKLHSVF